MLEFEPVPWALACPLAKVMIVIGIATARLSRSVNRIVTEPL
jgi:hypothetical protein